MSNLSELLPAGSSVKSADFVAQGTLASGVTVALRSDGKVEAISATGGPASAGTPVEFETEISKISQELTDHFGLLMILRMIGLLLPIVIQQITITVKQR